MKYFFLLTFLLPTIRSATLLEGTLLFDGETLDAKIETNIQSPDVIVGGVDYSVVINNHSYIAANQDQDAIDVYFGSILPHYINADKTELVERFGLKNGDELNCNQNSLAFVVLHKANQDVFGNCVNP